MPEEEDDRHAWEVCAHPAKEEVCPYVLDQAPPRYELPVKPIGPPAPQPTAEHFARRPEVLLSPVVRPEVLLALEVLECIYPARVERLEDVAVLAPVVDDLRDPRRPGPTAPCEEDGGPVVAPQVHVEPAEKPLEAGADHVTNPLSAKVTARDCTMVPRTLAVSPPVP